MQQLSRVCMFGNHYLRQVEYVCIFPGCTLSRFLCKECLKFGIHRHQQHYQNHILDHKELYNLLNKRFSDKGEKIKTDFFHPLKQIIQEIQYQLKNIINMIQQQEQELLSDDSNTSLNQKLLLQKNNGFNQLDEEQLNMLLQEVGDIYSEISNQSNHLTQNIIRIQQLCNSQKMDNNEIQIQNIKNIQHNLITQDKVKGEFLIYASAISNDFQYIVYGGTDQKLKIWNYDNNSLIKQVQLDNCIFYIKFKEDSRFLYVGTSKYLMQFDVNNQFIETYNQTIHSEAISTILLIANTIVLTSSFDKTIIKTDINFKQQLLLIKAHDDFVLQIDYDRNLNIIASASSDRSLKLWNGNNGQLIVEKKMLIANIYINLDSQGLVIIWNINYLTSALDEFKQIQDSNIIVDISLVLDQQYIILVCYGYIKINTIKGDYVRSIKHDVKDFVSHKITQPDSMKAFLILGKQTLEICKLDID